MTDTQYRAVIQEALRDARPKLIREARDEIIAELLVAHPQRTNTSIRRLIRASDNIINGVRESYGAPPVRRGRPRKAMSGGAL